MLSLDSSANSSTLFSEQVGVREPCAPFRERRCLGGGANPLLKVLVPEERDFSRGTLYCTGSLPVSVGWHRHSGHLFLPFPSHALEGDAWIVLSELYRCWATTFTFLLIME